MQLNNQEIHKLFIDSVRYSLTRRSYAPSECADLIRSRWQEIPENTKRIIVRDINEAIEQDEKLVKFYSGYYRWPADVYRTWVDLRSFAGANYLPKRRSLAEACEDVGAPVWLADDDDRSDETKTCE